MAGSGHASAFFCYMRVGNFVAVATSLYSPLIFLLAILLEIHADRCTLIHRRRANHPHRVFQR
jgi:hypothetical protein